MGKKTGALIKEARTGAKLTQEALAKAVGNLTAADISKAERGEKELTQATLKAIAKATGVTQASLLNAEKNDAPAEKKASAKSSKTSAAKSGSKSTASLTADEKKLLDLYRKADTDARKDALRILKGEKSEVEQLVSSMLGGKMSLDKLLKQLK